MSWRKWVALVLLPALYVAAVIGVERLVANSVTSVPGQGDRGYWTESITAVSTVVVMAATSVYAALSYRMVQAMRQQNAMISASPTRSNVAELSRFATTWIKPLLALKWAIAQDSRSTVDRMAELDEAILRVHDANWQLVAFGSDCPPEIHRLIGSANAAATAATEIVELVRRSISEAALKAVQGNLPLLEDLYRRRLGHKPGSPVAPWDDSRASDPSWDEVREEYLLHVRNDAPGRPEWEDIMSAKWLDDATAASSELITACTAYLHGVGNRTPRRG